MYTNIMYARYIAGTYQVQVQPGLEFAVPAPASALVLRRPAIHSQGTSAGAHHSTETSSSSSHHDQKPN